MIIGFSGTKGSGKNTAADLVRAELSVACLFEFADELKRICRTVFGLSLAQTDGWAKEVPFSEPIEIDCHLRDIESELAGLKLSPAGMIAHTPRQLLQYVGTEYVRAADDGYWVRFVIDRAKRETLALITDARFQNEVDAVRSAGGIVLRINRYPAGPDAHPSETGISKLTGCFDIDNTGTLDDLGRVVNHFVRLADRLVDIPTSRSVSRRLAEHASILR